MWVVPSHGRPRLLKRLAESFKDSDLLQPVAVIVCDQDPTYVEYMRMALPPTWSLHLAQGDYSYCGQKMNYAFKIFPDAKFYGHLCDDVWIETPGMLRQLSDAAGDWKISFPADGIYDDQPPENLVCFPCMGGELVRALGWWAFPPLLHNCIDSVITDIGRSLNLLVNMRHLRLGMLGPGERAQPQHWDDTYQRVEKINLDAGTVHALEWEKKERAPTLERVREAMRAANA